MRYVIRWLAALLLAGSMAAPASAALYLQTFSMPGTSNFGPGTTFTLNAEVIYDSTADSFVYKPTYLVDGVALTGGTHIVENLASNMRARSTFRFYPVYGTFEFFIRFLPRLTSDGSFSGAYIYSNANLSSSESFTATAQVTVVDYEPPKPQATVPEPMSLALLGLGVAGLAVTRRRLKAA